ncbi:MAG: ATP-grasp domain-containing protein, partial [Betaproteobacteria bacterium]|nr:ATP-grasp domain-containing protein [Betaproteobacteria bacterium]
RFQQMLHTLGLRQPPNATARTEAEALEKAQQLGYPLVVRPSYVLGGRAMEIVHEQRDLERYMREAVKVSHESPVLLDRFLNDAIECDVDAICDGKQVFIGGVMEHIEQAGVHSGDSACSLPPYSLSPQTIQELKRQTTEMAHGLNVVGLMNVQFALKDGTIYVLEVNPRASRTVPFVAKVIGKPIAKIASRIMAGESLASFKLKAEPYDHIAVKEAVFPFARFPGVDVVLGPEMRSTGEVIGLDKSFGVAFAKSQLGSGTQVPKKGTVFVSVRDADKERIVPSMKMLADLGFSIVASEGTQKHLATNGIKAAKINKVLEGRPHIVDAIKNGDVQLVFNTTEGKQALTDS